MSDLPKLNWTKPSDITGKVKVPEKVPVPPPVSLPDVPPMNASTTILDDVSLWLRNRLKRMASQEGQGIDAGGLVAGVGKLIGVGAFFAQWWIPILAMVVIVGLLLALRVI